MKRIELSALEQEKLSRNLVRGMQYQFKPVILAEGLYGRNVLGGEEHALAKMLFNSGRYIGIIEGFHTFVGRPLNTPDDFSGTAVVFRVRQFEEVPILVVRNRKKRRR